jgi:hypothetical protein
MGFMELRVVGFMEPVGWGGPGTFRRKGTEGCSDIVQPLLTAYN